MALTNPRPDAPPAPLPQPAFQNQTRLIDRFLVWGLFLWTFLSLCFPLVDTDFWWHLKTGELILDEGQLPQIDWYTFTDFDKPWIDLHWGFQVLITVLYRLGGVNLVILAKAAIITGTAAIGWSAGGRGLPRWGKTALWILPIICFVNRGYERPEMLSLLFLACWIWLARQVEERSRLIWLTPLVQLAWVNCHGLFVLGLIVGACYLADVLARRFARGRWGLSVLTTGPSFRAIAWTGIVVLLTALVNPYFEEGALLPLTLYRKLSVDQDFYSIWVAELIRPVDLLTAPGWSWLRNPFLLSELMLWCLAAWSFVWLLLCRGSWSILRLLLFAAFTYLAWKAERNMNIFALVAGFVACENLEEGMRPNRAAVPGEQPRSTRATWGVMAVVLGLIVTVVTGIWSQFSGMSRPFALGEARNWFIHDAARFAGQDGFPRRAFVVNYGQAAVYVYHNSPRRLVFMDGRLEVCTRSTFESYLTIMAQMATSNSGWQQVFQQQGGELPVVILDNIYCLGQIRGMLRMPGWRLVYADPAASVFLSDPQADKLSLPAIAVPPSLDEALRVYVTRPSVLNSHSHQ